MRRLLGWLRSKMPPRPPDMVRAGEDHARTRQHAFWSSEVLLDQLRDLECVAEEIRQGRAPHRRGE